MSVTLRTAKQQDASAIHGLVTANLENGHLLPRSLEDIDSHISRFFVAVVDEQVIGCAELAPLSPSVAEVRSLVVQEARRGQRIGTRLVSHLREQGHGCGVRDAVRIHSRPGAFRAARVHHRPAHLDAGEDRARLHRLFAVPAVRSVRGQAGAAAGDRRARRNARPP